MNMDPEVIAAAIEGFEQQARRIEGHLAQLRSMLGKKSVAPPLDLSGLVKPAATAKKAAKKAAKKGKRKLSAEARAKMAEAQKRRWAAVRAAKK